MYTELKNVFEDYEKADEEERARIIRTSQATSQLKHQGLYSDFLSSPVNQTFVDETEHKIWFQLQLPFVPQIGMTIHCGISDFNWDEDIDSKLPNCARVHDLFYDRFLDLFLVELGWSLHNCGLTCII